MSTINRAIAIAAEAHAGQTDKAGAPYILHPLRVMLRVQSPAERIVAMLHDVVEDCPAWPLQRLADEGFSQPVLAAIGDLTRRAGQSYNDYIIMAGQRRLSRAVKLADLADNLDESRGAVLSASQVERYRKAQAYLLGLD